MITTLEQPVEFSTIFEHTLFDFNGKSTGMKQIYDLESREYLSTVTSKYQPVEHCTVKDLALITLNKLGLDFDLKENYPNYGRESYLRFIIKGIDEKVNPLITIKNGYKSGNSLKLITGTYTAICKNGAVLGVKSNDQNFRHIKNTEFSNAKNGLFMNEISGFIQGFAGHLTYLETIKAIEMKQEMITEFLSKFSDKDAKNIFNLFKGQGTSNRQDNSVHSFYQTCTEYFSHSLKGKNIDKKQIIALTSVQFNLDRVLKLVA